MRIASIILSSIPFLVAMGFLIALGLQTGPEGFGVIIAFLWTCIPLVLMGGIGLLLSLLKSPKSKLDVPSRVVSIISLVCFAPPAAFGLIFMLMYFIPDSAVPA